MFLNILFIVLLQICYCSADCPVGFIGLPIYAIYIIGITMSLLLFATVVLAVNLYRLKRENGSNHSIFGNHKLSISKYERQVSGNSTRMIKRDSMNDDTVQLKDNEKTNDNDDDTDRESTITDEARVDIEPKPVKLLNKTQIAPKIPIFPQMAKEQINELCEAVLSRHRMKECTSLSDLDKIVNDAKDEKSKAFDTSASTPELDILDASPSPVPVKTLPVFDENSKESKLRDEMKAMFSKNEFKSKFNTGKKAEEKTDEIDFKDETKSKYQTKSNDDFKPNEETTYEEDLEKKLLKTDLDMKIAKCINDEIMAKFSHGGLKTKTSKVEKSSKLNTNDAKQENEDVNDDEIYDCLPKSRSLANTPSDEIYDFPPSPKPCNEMYDFPPSDDMYDFLPSPKPSDETYDFPPSPKPSDDMYDSPSTAKSHHDVYDSVPVSRNINSKQLLSCDDAAAYVFPKADSNLKFEDPQYSNAKILPEKDNKAN